MSSPSALPVREIPGDYGLPFFGPIRDRLSYYYTQGEVQYFKSRMQKHNSTIFRCNMPPGPFMARDPRVICLLDAMSFPVLFDNSKVEKRDVLDGTFMPSLAYTGGYRALAYLDTSEPNHATLKQFFFSLLAKKHDKFIPLFQRAMSGLISGLEDQVSSKGSANYNDLNDTMSFEFVFRLFCDKDPLETTIGPKGAKIVDKWLLFQLHPLMTLGLKFVPNVLEDLMLHTLPLPSFLVRSDYKKLYDAFYEFGDEILDEAESQGIKRDEACHNLVFLAGFNAYGGMKRAFPALIKWVGGAGEGLHHKLADEIRAEVKKSGVTFASIEEMKLTNSVVYEALRIEPPVPYQYGKAKEDIQIKNHDHTFLVKQGEMLFGYQPIATKDPRVFKNPDVFVPDRFVGEGEKLVKYVYWSNGRETDKPAADNKQCPAKDLVVLLCRLLLIEIFLRYDTFDAEVGKIQFGSAIIQIKSLTRTAHY